MIIFSGDGTAWLGNVWSTSRSPEVVLGKTQFFRPNESQPSGTIPAVQLRHFKDPLHDPDEIRTLARGLMSLANQIDGK